MMTATLWFMRLKRRELEWIRIKNNMSQEFKNLISYLEKLKSRYFHALSAFFIYKTLDELTARNIVGNKNAQDNVDVIKRYKNFFIPSKEALRVYSLLELAKMFDISDESLHITKIVNCAQSQIKKLTVDDFKKFYQDRDFLEELIRNYEGIDQKDIKEIKEILEKNEDVLQRLKDYRNQYLAHDDINKNKISIEKNEIDDLFKTLGKILNLISYKLNCSSSIWDHIENNSKESTEMIFDYLKRFEPYRLKEIDEECKAELHKLQNKNKL